MKTLLPFLLFLFLTLLPQSLSLPLTNKRGISTPLSCSKVNIIEQGTAPWSLQRISGTAPVTQNGRPTTELSYKYRFTELEDGEGVEVYIVDTGIDVDHPEFGKRARNAISTFDDDLEENSGHGTQIAGAIGSLTYGVAKNVSLVGIKVFSPLFDTKNPTALISNITSGIESAILLHNARRAAKNFKGSIMNLGFGFPKEIFDAAGQKASNEFKKMLQKAVDDGMHVTIAAGDRARDACTDFPAGFVKDIPALIVVGATDVFDKRLQTADFGPCIDIHAPGVDIVSTTLRGVNGGIKVDSGTFLSAGIVTGVIAGEMGKNKNLRTDPVGMKRLVKDKALKGILRGVEGGGDLLVYSGMPGNPVEEFV
ncbi:hypothetical protein TWF225_005427 [Orbilia oligospora]|uniref:Uncharacterized protein n=1 Tax=Orbilia oligospora TaxID=2813651 RepID=A0A7C8PL10_ORBOL|nr:hypothetical protein TWF751_006433 [Orbilia oligospora]KAF3194809.1 hypothetical protein TWF225_005427 [Orbilia oligospora]KAF3257396.1 hypothetical protein TWF128_004958 [Orbilia oligospora]KAF3270749.1 hypothetical protein TWF217_007025 [Orbilia oligospora]KAF3295319.1 hypothetical protein TWF132_002013 [Orbilia oligospora]